MMFRPSGGRWCSLRTPPPTGPPMVRAMAVRLAAVDLSICHLDPGRAEDSGGLQLPMLQGTILMRSSTTAAEYPDEEEPSDSEDEAPPVEAEAAAGEAGAAAASGASAAGPAAAGDARKGRPRERKGMSAGGLRFSNIFREHARDLQAVALC